MNQAVQSSPIEDISVTEASQTLESTRLSLIEAMKNDAQNDIKTAEKTARIAERAVDSHESSEPKVGLFKGKTAHEEWSKQLDSLHCLCPTLHVLHLKLFMYKVLTLNFQCKYVTRHNKRDHLGG